MSVDDAGFTHVSTPGSRQGFSWRRGWLATVGLGTLLLIVTLGLAIFDEPYHIDELRQVGYYDQGFGEIAQSALSQDQPPLDYWIGKIVREVMGRPSDSAERAPAALFAVFAGLGMSLLLWWSGRPSIAWIPPVVAALSPLYLAFGAYARPYGLPTVLMIGFVVLAEGWRRSRKWWVLPFLYLFAGLLPLSRAVEPPLFLVGVVLVLGTTLLANRAEGWTIPVLIAGAVGLAVSFPVYRQLSVATADYRTESFNELAVVLQRIREALAVIATEQPLGLLLLAVGFVAAGVVAVRIVRGRSPDGWWLLPLLGTPVAFVLLFGLVAIPSVPYFTRYAFFFVLPVSTGYALAVALPTNRVAVQRLQVAAVGIVSIALIFLAVPSTVRALSTTTIPDYRTASRAVNDEIARGTEVLYEEGTTVKEYRNHSFPGVPRYSSGPIYATFVVARDRLPIGDGPVAILSRGEKLEAEGWVVLTIDDDFVVYTPRDDLRWGQHELGDALRSLCESGDVESYGFLCVVSAQALAAAGDRVSAEALLKATEQRAREAGVLERFGMFFDPLQVLG